MGGGNSLAEPSEDVGEGVVREGLVPRKNIFLRLGLRPVESGPVGCATVIGTRDKREHTAIMTMEARMSVEKVRDGRRGELLDL